MQAETKILGTPVGDIEKTIGTGRALIDRPEKETGTRNPSGLPETKSDSRYRQSCCTVLFNILKPFITLLESLSYLFIFLLCTRVYNVERMTKEITTTDTRRHHRS